MQAGFKKGTQMVRTAAITLMSALLVSASFGLPPSTASAQALCGDTSDAPARTEKYDLFGLYPGMSRGQAEAIVETKQTWGCGSRQLCVTPSGGLFQYSLDEAQRVVTQVSYDFNVQGGAAAAIQQVKQQFKVQLSASGGLCVASLPRGIELSLQTNIRSENPNHLSLYLASEQRAREQVQKQFEKEKTAPPRF
jgi:hypothetical protein